MNISPITAQDLPRVALLQPEDWPPLIPSFSFYISSPFCRPVKYETDGQLVGVGAAILHAHTAWIGHIIVDKTFRNQGIGTTITRMLTTFISNTNIKTIQLIATAMGEPVYKKLGFQKETEYLFLKGGQLPRPDQSTIQSFDEQHTAALLKLDQHTTGEDRTALLTPHLPNTHVLLNERDTLQGFYMPTLGEGLAIASTPEAGLQLLQKQATEKTFIVMPQENTAGINYLHSHGYKEYRKGIRMWLGERIRWQPNNLYSRIGGNLG